MLRFTLLASLRSAEDCSISLLQKKTRRKKRLSKLSNSEVASFMSARALSARGGNSRCRLWRITCKNWADLLPVKMPQSRLLRATSFASSFLACLSNLFPPNKFTNLPRLVLRSRKRVQINWEANANSMFVCFPSEMAILRRGLFVATESKNQSWVCLGSDLAI